MQASSIDNSIDSPMRDIESMSMPNSSGLNGASNLLNRPIMSQPFDNSALSNNKIEIDEQNFQNTNQMNRYSIEHPQDRLLPSIEYVEASFWCTISYYELNQHVGESFHASQSSFYVDGYVDPSSPDRFCLGVLSNVNRKYESEQCRKLIGRGVRIYHEGGEVYASNLSDSPIFVQSINSNTINGWHEGSVVKLAPGALLKIFSHHEFVNILTRTVPLGYKAVFELTKMCSVRISFVKGWGPDYRRQAITSTPCWIEVRLNGPFQWLDRIWPQMNGPGNLSS